ncbi:MAG TPA: aminotransferase class V-fold PLP-dependent enzyme [Burkholderiales bacterium]|nr:aminotransferase class V-fold PLP-dependent enzyme [Burkholderiales bacterium]
MLASHYGTFFASNGDALHVTAHSHHPWPDVTRAAHLQYWEDSARLTNRKWQDKVFGEVVPEAQDHVARHLGLADPKLVAFATNTHEFVARLYSCLDWSRVPRVLTTASEFHSFARQTRRLEETGRLQVTRVPVEPYATFRDRFRQALGGHHDLVFLSQVFFDSSFVVERLDALVAGISAETIVAIDGYHAFMAIPVDLGTLGRRVFYTAGGYKYAQAGEGACFLSIPEDCQLRPVFTGWYSDFGQLSGAQGAAVGYGPDAMRFWGSTFDPSGLYRFNAVMRWLHRLGVTAHEIHAHVEGLEHRFLDGLSGARLARLPVAALTPPAGQPRGNFLTFDLDDAAEAEQRLATHGIVVDRRGRRLRFGFGVYHDAAFVDALLARLREALA